MRLRTRNKKLLQKSLLDEHYQRYRIERMGNEDCTFSDDEIFFNVH